MTFGAKSCSSLNVPGAQKSVTRLARTRPMFADEIDDALHATSAWIFGAPQEQTCSTTTLPHTPQPTMTARS